MKNFIKASLVAVALLVNISANAQIPLELGVKAGVNLSNFGGDIENYEAKAGFNIGITVDYAIASELYLLSGLELTTKGAKSKETIYNGTKQETSINPIYLQLPVHLGYKLEMAPETKLVFHAGPYIAYGIGGKAKESKKINDVNHSTDTKIFGDNGYDKLDIGVGLGASVELGKIGVGLGYDFGLNNISGESAYKVKNQNAYLTVGYKF
jgi:hypothetical protein